MQLNRLFSMRNFTPISHPRWNDYFGVELELENVRHEMSSPYWDVHGDASLRNGVEFVFSQALGGNDVVRALDAFYGSNVRSSSTERASTHIHINMSDASVDTLRTMIMLMYVLEPALYTAVGEHRKWGGYSMPLSEMESSRLTTILQGSDMSVHSMIATGRNQDRYYGFNLSAVRKHGTVEFRYFPADPTRQELESWLDLTKAIKHAAKMLTPSELIERVNSPDDLINLLRGVLPVEWRPRLLTVLSPEAMFEEFNAVAAMATPSVEGVTRRDQLVFLSGPLLKFATTRLLQTDTAKNYLLDIAPKLEVITSSEWNWHMTQARRLDAGLELAAQETVPPLSVGERIRQATRQVTTSSSYYNEHSPFSISDPQPELEDPWSDDTYEDDDE